MMGERSLKRLWLLSLVLNCFTSPLLNAETPTVNFSRGQPEIGQPSDNIPIGPMVIKSMFEPIGDGRGYPMLLTNKTTILLGEALHMLNRVKNVKERHWIKNFIMQLGNLADTLMANAMNITIPPEIHTTDSEHRPHPTITTVEGPISVNAMRKHEVSSTNPETLKRVSIKNQNSVIPEQSEPIADDVLVRQLKDMSKIDLTLRNLRSSAVVPHEEAVKTTTEDTLIYGSIMIEVEETAPIEKEKEKEAILTKLADLVIRLRQLGGNREDIMKALRFNDFKKVADFTDPEFYLDSNHNKKNGTNEFEIVEENKSVQATNITRGAKETKKNELTISSPNDSFRNQAMSVKSQPIAPNQPIQHFTPQPLDQRPYMLPLHGYVTPQLFQNRPHPYYHAQQRNGMHMNDRYMMRQPNYYQRYPIHNPLRQMYPNGPYYERQYFNPQSPPPAYPNAFVNPSAAQYLPTPYGSPETSYPTFVNSNAGQQYVEPMTAFVNRNAGQYQSLESRPPHPGYTVDHRRNSQLYSKPIPKPFQYLANNGNELQQDPAYINMSVVHPTPPYPRTNYQPPYADPHLNDEMERQLRDGKIIVLSDSVVHSNFKPTAKDKEGQKEESTTKANK